MSTVLPTLRYSAEHEWVDDASPARIGISRVAADNLGDIVFIELPEPGSTVTAGDVCGEVESTKSVSEVYSPVTGTVVEVNAQVVGDPALLNEDPYGAGWLFTVEVVEEGPLLSAVEYAKANGGDLA